MNARVEIKHLLPAWEAFRASTDIGPVRSKAHYKRMASLLEALLEETEGAESHPAMELVDVVGDFIADYESHNAAMPAATGVDALRFLMQQHGITQAALPEVGSQGVVSEILSGARELNVRQVRALAERFGVSPATFI
jgi:HTH-type transcriptional regulator / antitoxin HigA